jgi:hypothetical protein
MGDETEEWARRDVKRRKRVAGRIIPYRSYSYYMSIDFLNGSNG